MVTDLRQAENGFVREADLCIIGGGAAGIAMAQRFAGLSIQVCLVESGGLDFEARTQELYAGTSVGQPVELEGGRVRCLGGSTSHWGGRCAELSEAEVVRRSWVPDSGWPLQLDELEPYYELARKVCGFRSEWEPNDAALRRLRVPTLPNFTTAVTNQVWRFAPSDGGLFLNFGKAYYDALRRAPNIELLLHANVTKFQTDDGAEHVRSIAVQTLSGVTGRIAAKYYVLCCGGIENARLLLAAGERPSEALGNTHGLVGRYFMEHPRAIAATLFPSDAFTTIQDVFNEFTDSDGVKYQVGLTLSEQAQRSGRLLNCSAVFDYHGDPESATAAARDIWRNLQDGRWPGDFGADVWRVVRDLRSLKPNLERRLRYGRPPLLPVQFAYIIVDIEQAPNPQSRISLSNTRDALGMREVVVDWRLSDLERQTVRQFMIELGTDFARRGIGRLRLAPWVEAADKSWESGVYETYHYMGATRMSSDPHKGVVNADCGVHGMDNLFIAGSSVFPTGGHVNPTLTIVALALRLADHIEKRMAS